MVYVGGGVLEEEPVGLGVSIGRGGGGVFMDCAGARVF